MINGISDSTEMIEIMKLSSALDLNSLLKVAEHQFQGHMLSFLDMTNNQ